MPSKSPLLTSNYLFPVKLYALLAVWSFANFHIAIQISIIPSRWPI